MLTGECSYCNKGKIIWGSDESFEDHSIEGEGIVQNFSCSSCSTSFVVYVNLGNQENE